MSVEAVCACVYSIPENKVYVSTPPANETRRVTIELETASGSRFDTNREFEYRDNPVFFNITPRNHLTV